VIPGPAEYSYAPDHGDGARDSRGEDDGRNAANGGDAGETREGAEVASLDHAGEVVEAASTPEVAPPPFPLWGES
jgi:hypothetical protein